MVRREVVSLERARFRKTLRCDFFQLFSWWLSKIQESPWVSWRPCGAVMRKWLTCFRKRCPSPTTAMATTKWPIHWIPKKLWNGNRGRNSMTTPPWVVKEFFLSNIISLYVIYIYIYLTKKLLLYIYVISCYIYTHYMYLFYIYISHVHIDVFLVELLSGNHEARPDLRRIALVQEPLFWYLKSFWRSTQVAKTFLGGHFHRTSEDIAHKLLEAQVRGLLLLDNFQHVPQWFWYEMPVLWVQTCKFVKKSFFRKDVPRLLQIYDIKNRLFTSKVS